MKTFITADNTFFDVYRESSISKNVFTGGNTTSLGFTMQNDNNLLTVACKQNAFEIKHTDYKTGLGFKLADNTKLLILKYQHGFGLLRASIAAEAAHANGEQLFNFASALEVILPFSFLNRYALTFSRITVPLQFRAQYATEQIFFNNPLCFTSVAHAFSAGTAQQHYDFMYTKKYPLSSGGKENMSVDNNSVYNEFVFDYTKASGNVELRVQYHNLYLSSDAMLINSGLSFGNMVLKNLDYNKGEITYSYKPKTGSNYSVSGAYYSLRGGVVGSIESWPFTSVINSLFVNRAYFRASGKAEVVVLHGTYTFTNGNLQLLPGLSFIHIFPELFTETWQPEFLVFGRKNYDASELELKSAGLMLLELNGGYKIKQFHLQFELAQFLPVYTNKQKKQGSTGVAPGPAESSKKVSTDGGRSLRLQLMYAF
ncbi:MAG: hypothetical protein HYV28_11615 [Ignavibacteriales bacterium]|nr:hypothetical protein [Ignavibacteriales bacterium]